MKKQNWIYGTIFAVAMLMCGTSIASPFTDHGIYSEPIYDTVAFTADPADAVTVADNGPYRRMSVASFYKLNSDKPENLECVGLRLAV